MPPIGDICTPVSPHSSPSLVEPLEFHSVNPTTIPHIDNDLDWVDTPIPIANHNPVNNQLAEAL